MYFTASFIHRCRSDGVGTAASQFSPDTFIVTFSNLAIKTASVFKIKNEVYASTGNIDLLHEEIEFSILRVAQIKEYTPLHSVKEVW